MKYVDLPLQHASGKVLKRMGRHGDRATLTALIEKMRARIPGLTLRTTFITGFPGETEEDFTELAEFVKEVKFDRMGCFPYSQEEGTIAGEMDDQVDDDIKQHRAELIMDSQMRIMEEKNQEYIGEILEAT